MNPDGSGGRRVTDKWTMDPAYGPKANRIVYARFDGHAYTQIFTINIDNGRRRQVTDRPASQRDPVLSPNGKRIAYDSDLNGGIWSIRADGTGERQVTHDTALDDDPAWSPNGKRIAYDSDLNGTWDISTIQPDGTGKRQITHDGCGRNRARVVAQREADRLRV